MQDLLNILNCNLIASGGVSSVDDLRRLAAPPGLHGAIIGKALLRWYDHPAASRFP